MRGLKWACANTLHPGILQGKKMLVNDLDIFMLTRKGLEIWRCILVLWHFFSWGARLPFGISNYNWIEWRLSPHHHTPTAKLQIRKTKYTNLSHEAEIWVLKIRHKNVRWWFMSFNKKKQIKETASIIFGSINQLSIQGYICAAVLIQGNIFISFIHLLLKWDFIASHWSKRMAIFHSKTHWHGSGESFYSQHLKKNQLTQWPEIFQIISLMFC